MHDCLQEDPAIMKRCLFIRLSAIIAAALLLTALVFGCSQTDEVQSILSPADTVVNQSDIPEIVDISGLGTQEKLALIDQCENSADFTRLLGLGWNLGNTFDSEGNSETSWGVPYVTEEFIDKIAAHGFTTIRIPVTWHTRLSNQSDYTIDEKQLDRVQEVVDWALDAGLFVVLNSHHDCDYYYPSDEHMEQSRAYITAIWTQLCVRFSDYDTRLIFEGMNEPRLKGTNSEWWFAYDNEEGLAALENVMELNELFVDTVRSFGASHAERYLACPSYAAAPDFTTFLRFNPPQDSRVIVSVHSYSPYEFALNKNGTNEWSSENPKDVDNAVWYMPKLYQRFISQGIGVMLGECGAMYKENDAARIDWARTYFSTAAESSLPCFLWDNGIQNRAGAETFGLIDRSSGEIYSPDYISAVFSAYYGE